MPSFILEPRGPFSLARAADVVANFPPLRHQPRVSGGLRLGFVLDGDHASVAVTVQEVGGALHGTISGTDRIDAVARQVARVLSLDHDGTDYAALGEADPRLGDLMRALPGLRPVCFTSPYEAACWAVVSQRITKIQAARAVAELVRARGEVVGIRGEAVAVFPRPDRLLDLRTVAGVSAAKVERLRGIARAALDGELDAERLRRLGDVAGPAALRRLPGIGPFWGSGIYLRACGIADVFPDEPMSIAALGRLHGLGDRPAPSTVARLTDAYRPFRMWVCFLLRVAAARGQLDRVAA
jgi:DNA-3-methyladenine glycosylase II